VRLNDESEIMVSPASKYYWRRLIDFCGRHKLRVVYLDDFETFEKVMEKRAEAETYKQRLRSFFERLESERSIYTETNYVREWMEAGYRADVEAEYIFIVGREKKILENIQKTNPSIVVMGKGHGDIIFLNRGSLETQGISFGQYLREIAGLRNEEADPFEGWTISAVMPEFDKKLPSFITYEGPDPSVVVERELLQRSYNAVTQMRILPERKPDFIGTWFPKLRSRGLFEVYIEERRDGGGISGTIEDILGTAGFEGHWNGQKISFKKNYDAQKSQGQSHYPLFYQGNLENGTIRGHYDFISDGGIINYPGQKDSFVLFQGDQFKLDLS